MPFFSSFTDSHAGFEFGLGRAQALSVVFGLTWPWFGVVFSCFVSRTWVLLSNLVGAPMCSHALVDLMEGPVLSKHGFPAPGPSLTARCRPVITVIVVAVVFCALTMTREARACFSMVFRQPDLSRSSPSSHWPAGIRKDKRGICSPLPSSSPVLCLPNLIPLCHLKCQVPLCPHVLVSGDRHTLPVVKQTGSRITSSLSVTLPSLN